jgi:hypothetical protein
MKNIVYTILVILLFLNFNSFSQHKINQEVINYNQVVINEDGTLKMKDDTTQDEIVLVNKNNNDN